MRIEVAGTYEGTALTLAWEDGRIEGPAHVTEALCDRAALMVGRTLYCANGDRIREDFLEHPVGFVDVAFQVLQDASTEWEPEPTPDNVLA